MERMMVVLIALVAIVAVGGLLYIGVHKAPEITPVFVQGHVLEAPDISMPSDSTDVGQIKFTIAPPSDSATGKISFEMK
ncbi:hypothetical protein KY338_03665 [Candidatus Woesearchaeota archaeon]|nr:hypothetical protein [Candidatus Woesearchaeota archaeon]MBW3005298.1 hypothetical protein [Candidatus Woesearchaeota archaeon]